MRAVSDILRRPRLPGSLTGRLTLAAVGAVAIALAVAGAAVVISNERADRVALDRDLEAATQRVLGPARAIVRAPGPPGGPGGPGGPGEPGGPAGRGFPAPPPGIEPSDTRAEALQPEPDRFVRIVGPGGEEVVTPGGEFPSDFPMVEPGEVRTVSAGGEDWRTVTRPIGPRGALIQAAGRLEPLQDDAARLRLVVALAVLVALAMTALLARWLVGLALAPLGGLRAAAGRIATSGDPADRMPRGDGPEEVRELAADLDAMLERLERSAADREQALEAARRFAADAGHELRTPLTSLQANLSAVESGGHVDELTSEALRAADADTVRLAGLVGQLQALARGEAGTPLETADLDLAELAEAASASLGARHPEVTVELKAPESGLPIRGDSGGVAMLLDNLLENAAVHGRPGGRIEISLSVGEDGLAEVIVDDDGPGVPADERESVLDRFVRGSAAQGSGSGLGLAIASAQAERHGGSLELAESPLGGLRATARLGAAG